MERAEAASLACHAALAAAALLWPGLPGRSTAVAPSSLSAAAPGAPPPAMSSLANTMLSALRRDPASAIAAAVSVCALAAWLGRRGACVSGGGVRAAALAATLACLHLAAAPSQALAHGCCGALRRDVLAAGALRSLLLVRHAGYAAPAPPRCAALEPVRSL